VKLSGALAAEGSAPPSFGRPGRALVLFAVVAGTLLAALATDLLGLDGLIRACSAAFVAVYVTSTAAGVRLLDGAGRRLAAVSFAAVVVVFGFFGAYLVVPAVVAAVALARRPRVVAVAPAA
jgi:amino acid efflux transporter